MNQRKIDQRFTPPVKGIDLWQAKNYIALDDVSLDFVYNAYTSSTICYVPGSRPVLEEIVKKVCSPAPDEFQDIASLAKYVATEVAWAGYYAHQTGKPLLPDRNLSEEQIIDSKFGWCNEQARVFCALAQIRGIPARLVFASNQACTYGHVLCEVLTSQGWMVLDQSFGYCFIQDGRPVNAWEVGHLDSAVAYFAPQYLELCKKMEAKIGRDILTRDFKMATVENPFSGFEALGYCSFFV